MRTRQGVSTLFVALGLLLLLGMVAFFHFGISRQALGSVQRNHLAALARVQGRSAIEEVLAQFSLEVNVPGTEVYQAVRQQLGTAWTTIDVGPLMRPPEVMIQPSWGVASEAERRSPIEGEIVEWIAFLRSPRRSFDPAGTEEWVAILTITVKAKMKSPHGEVSRISSASYEVRCLLSGPPRPFDQVAIYMGGLEAATDIARANQLRQELLDEHEQARQDILAAAAANPGPVGDRLSTLGQAMKPPDEVAAGVRPLPEVPVAFFGPYHVHDEFPLTLLSPIDELEAGAEDRAAKKAAFDAALAGGDGDALKQAAFDLIAAFNLTLSDWWGYRWHFNMLETDSERYQRVFEPFQARLTPEYFLDRVHLEVGPDHPLLARWLQGEARLTGEVRVHAPEGLTLSGTARGRVNLVVTGGPVVLQDLLAGDPEDIHDDRLTIVSLGTDVEVQGNAEASVIMLAEPDGGPGTTGTFRSRIGSVLRGNLIAPHNATPANTELAGSLHYDPRLRNPPIAAAVVAATNGDPEPYVVVTSPAPIFLSGSNT